jgi:hypothetical protein
MFESFGATLLLLPLLPTNSLLPAIQDVGEQLRSKWKGCDEGSLIS